MTLTHADHLAIANDYAKKTDNAITAGYMTDAVTYAQAAMVHLRLAEFAPVAVEEATGDPTDDLQRELDELRRMIDTKNDRLVELGREQTRLQTELDTKSQVIRGLQVDLSKLASFLNQNGLARPDKGHVDTAIDLLGMWRPEVRANAGQIRELAGEVQRLRDEILRRVS